jgi:hypothetical protein
LADEINSVEQARPFTLAELEERRAIYGWQPSLDEIQRLLATVDAFYAECALAMDILGTVICEYHGLTLGTDGSVLVDDLAFDGDAAALIRMTVDG